MARRIFLAVLVICLTSSANQLAFGQDNNDGWISLFDGKTLNGWKASENKATFSVRDGMIVAQGPRSHLYYVGPVEDANFRDFEFKADVMTKPGANSGMYFHTEYRETDWPRKGYEVQVNNTHSDWRKTGSLYGIKDIRESPAKDNEWFTQHIIVDGRQVNVIVNGRTVLEYTVAEAAPGRRGRGLSSGTFALQGHDPGSTVYYKNIMVRPLPRPDFPMVDYHVHLKGGLTLEEAIENAAARGIKIGIAENCGLGFRVTDDEKLSPFFKLLQDKPVYKAMQGEGREWLNLFSPEMIAKFDYVFTDAMTFTDKRGKRIRLWIRNEVQIDDKQDFMDMYVEKIVSVLNEPIDMYVNPTFLPALIADEYDVLWTPERMDKVIRAAVKNDVAIEINARYRIPGMAFIKRAKKAGAKFSFGTNNGGRELGHLEYCRRMTRECGLTIKDMFSPRPDGSKPIQRRRVSR
ncbi:MAG TPA: family 16 glycoside hydrolase [Sedimentisphaerales bacterium]|nr:family 16 glycoside hydrolase [Sedimentisphaerales bacterium]